MIVLLALVWVPLTSHCRIEALPGLEFFRCATEAQAPVEQGDPCAEGGCCALEAAQYHAPRPDDALPTSLLGLLISDAFGVVERSLPPEVWVGVLTAAPPELSVSWLFYVHAAPRPRAPSFVS